MNHLLSNAFNVDGDVLPDGGDAAKKPSTTSKEDHAAVSQAPETKQGAESKKWTPLVLDCYFIDFDGNTLAPLH